MFEVDIVIGVDDHAPYTHAPYRCFGAVEDGLYGRWLIPSGVDKDEMFVYPFKRAFLFGLRHAVFAVKESALGIQLHQAGDVNLRLVFKRADGKLPVFISR